MSLMPFLQVPRSPVPAGQGDEPPEWLVANGLGGYAFGSVDGTPRRRFHGLLIAALPAPFGRTMLLNAVDEAVTVDGQPTVSLGPGTDEPQAPARFALVAGLPVWTFDLGNGLSLERSVVMPHRDNTVHVRYRLIGPPAQARLEIRPWLDVRPHQKGLDSHQQRTYAVTASPNGRVDVCSPDMPTVRLAAKGHAPSFRLDPRDRHELVYSIDHERGGDWLGSAHSSGVAIVGLDTDTAVYFTATAQAWDHLEALPPDTAWEAEVARRERLLATSDQALQSMDTFLVSLAADQFVIKPIARSDDTVRAHAAGAEPRSVIAGYPWFTDWGRDTMIGLEGLTLSTGRLGEARDILRTFARHVRDGLIPNLFPEGESEGVYHTADATLWFFHALDRYDVLSGDRTLVNELLDQMQAIVECHRAGTRFNIRVDADGLLTQGWPSLPLTWMDARMDGWVVTPRRGKAVEINALWHNALWLLHGWMARAGRGVLAEGLAHEARRCQEAFNARFWNARRKCLFDVVDGDAGDDDACRPNQLLAISVRHPPLDPSRWASVVEVVATELLTPFGLRTLSRDHPAYQKRYFGALRERDGAYHQGTVWPWLMGPFVDAWMKVHPDDAEGARTLLAPLLQHVMGASCVGSVCEIFDAEPPYTARGCVAQAWSVAELARLLVKLRVAGEGEGA
jgi:predicted glycogen debranching enzyme